MALVTRVLDVAGTVTALLVGSIILFLGGVQWFALLLMFLFVATTATRYKLEQKRRLGLAEGQTGTRSWPNVVANGAFSATLAVAYWATSLRPLGFAYLGAISTSMSDTLATELGLLNPYAPRLITNLHEKVPTGTSGGISLYGEVASFMGAGVVSITALLLGFGGSQSSIVFFSGLIGGLLGSTFDSLLGATVQATYMCQVCNKKVEKPLHCEQKAALYTGLRFMDNNAVNFLSTICGASMTVILSFLLST
ncbi:DUF92 domain-containing protein [Candidatus Bathyarchaeota archaeon]|nr:DUF92 domain-containing protein [Candidatus Bathyarchaeota archaeon]